MLNFFIRVVIIILALIICAGFSSATLVIPIILPIVFVCSWVFVKSFKKVIWEIASFALIYDFILSERVGLYFLIIFGLALIFNFINYSIFEVSGKRIFLAYASLILLSISIVISNFLFDRGDENFVFLLKQLLSYTLLSIVFFFIFSKLIIRLEKTISFYAQRVDVKRHR